MMSLTLLDFALITESKHIQSGDSRSPGCVGVMTMGLGNPIAGRERGKYTNGVVIELLQAFVSKVSRTNSLYLLLFDGEQRSGLALEDISR